MTIQDVFAASGGVLAFQQKHPFLKADGAAGPRTNNAALRVMLGLPQLPIPSASPGPDGVRRPGMDEIYGAFKFDHLPPDQKIGRAHV